MLKRLLPGLVSPWYWWKSIQELMLVWRVSQDPQVPWYFKLIPWLAVIYYSCPLILSRGLFLSLGNSMILPYYYSP